MRVAAVTDFQRKRLWISDKKVSQVAFLLYLYHNVQAESCRTLAVMSRVWVVDCSDSDQRPILLIESAPDRMGKATPALFAD